MKKGYFNSKQNRFFTRRHKHPLSFLGLILLFLTIVLVPGLAPISQARAVEVVITDPEVIVTAPILEVTEFVTCTCVDGRKTLISQIVGTDSTQACATACAGLPPPVSVQSCSGVSVDGRTLNSADRIVQCGPDALFQGGLGTTEQTVLDYLVAREKSAVDTVLSTHQLPEADRVNVMGFARDSARAFLYADLLGIVSKSDSQRTIGEQAIVGSYAEQVRLKRLDAAEFALSEFNRWNSVVCNNFGTGYVPPLGFSYPSQGGACTQVGQTFGGPQPPSSEELIKYGTAHAYSKLNTDAQTAQVAVKTARGMGLGVVLAGAAATGIAAALIVVFTSLGPIIITTIAPFAFVSVGGFASVAAASAAAGAAAGTVTITTAAAIGGVIAVVIVAIAIAVLQGIAVFAAAEIPGTLQAQVTAAQVAPDLRESIKTKEGLQEFYSVFIESTMPDFPATSAPQEPIASDRRFRVKDEAGQNVGVFNIISLQSPSLPTTNWEARLSGGWFVPRFVKADNTIAETLSLSLPYFDWENKKRIAWRRGNQFVVTNLDATTVADAGVVSDEIRYKDWDGTKLIASIAVDDTPPTITPNVTGTLGNESWYTSNINITWTVEELESAIQSKTGCGDRSITSDGISSFACEASSEGGTLSSPLTIKRDATVPDITGSRNPEANANGWNNASVSVSFTCTDVTSGMASCGADQTLNGEGAGQSVTANAVDKAGNSKNISVNGINIDKTAPDIAGSRSQGANANGWNNTDVAVNFTCTEALSGIASCGPNQTLGGDGAGQSATGNAVDKAGNSGTAATVGGINIDKTSPVVAVTGAANGATYTFGSVPTAGCSTSDALSGVQTSAVVSVTGGTSNGVSSFTATCAGAMDKAGNPGSSSVTYQVAYPFSTFFQPVDNLPIFNQIKAGAAVGVKFNLGGDFGLDILAAGSPGSQAITCSSSTLVDDIEQTVTAGSSNLSYDATSGQYSYIWKTSSSWSGTCRQLILTFDDGTIHKANFKFK